MYIGIYLKWLIDCRTASSNSIGPGMSNAGCSGCVDIFGAVELELDLLVGCGKVEPATESRSVV